MENTIAVVSDPLFLEHRAPEGHPERPERLGAARRALGEARLSVRVEGLLPRDATDDELGRVHTPNYLEELAGTAARRGYPGPDTYFAPGGSSGAPRAAGGGLPTV